MNIEVGPESDKLMTYNEAVMYCFCFTQDGKIGWRLPTVKELNSIWAMPGCDFARWYYWSSEEGDTGYAIDVDFNRQGIDYKSSPENKGYDDNLVRPVRDLKDD